MKGFESPSDRLLNLKGNNRLTESVERVNENKIVVTHVKHHTPKYGDVGEYVDWKRTIAYVRSNGDLVVHESTKSHHASDGEMHDVGRSPYTHEYELADDNETVVHDGRTWVEYARERSRELTNTRWQNIRDGRPDPKSAKDIVSERIEAEL